jgi:hypothetical protein
MTAPAAPAPPLGQPPAAAPLQLDLLTYYCPVQTIPQGDGTYLVKPGKPVEKLTVKKFAAAIGVTPSTVRRSIRSGDIPREYCHALGRTRWLIQSAAIAVYETRMANHRSGRCLCGADLPPAVPGAPKSIRCLPCAASYSRLLC